jgi:hypothetical protein
MAPRDGLRGPGQDAMWRGWNLSLVAATIFCWVGTAQAMYWGNYTVAFKTILLAYVPPCWGLIQPLSALCRGVRSGFSWSCACVPSSNLCSQYHLSLGSLLLQREGHYSEENPNLSVLRDLRPHGIHLVNYSLLDGELLKNVYSHVKIIYLYECYWQVYL